MCGQSRIIEQIWIQKMNMCITEGKCENERVLELWLFRIELRMQFKFQFSPWIWIEVPNRVQNCNANLNV